MFEIIDKISSTPLGIFIALLKTKRVFLRSIYMFKRDKNSFAIRLVQAATVLMVVAPSIYSDEVASEKLVFSKKGPIEDTSVVSVLEPASSNTTDIKLNPNQIYISNSYKSVELKEVKNNIAGFYVKKVTNESGTHLELKGLVSKKCLKHLRIELDTPLSSQEAVEGNKENSNQATAYSLRIERADFVKHDFTVVEKAEDACNSKDTAECNRESCIDIGEVIGVKNLQNTKLTQDGKILLKHENLHLPKGHPDAISYAELTKDIGGPLMFKTPETLAQEAAIAEAKKKKEEFEVACKGAENGEREALENLKEILGEAGIKKNKNLLASLEKKVSDAELDEFKKRMFDLDSLEASGKLIDDLLEYGLRPENKMVKAKVSAMLVQLSDEVLKIMNNSEKDTLDYKAAQFKMSERSLNAALKLNPKDKKLRVLAYQAKLRRWNWGANTGNDKFYNDATRAEAEAAYENVWNWAQNSQDQEIAALANSYQQQLAPAMTPISIPTMYGNWQTLVPMNQNERNFIQANQKNSQKKTILEEYQQYRQQYQQNGTNVNNQSANNSNNNSQNGLGNYPNAKSNFPALN